MKAAGDNEHLSDRALKAVELDAAYTCVATSAHSFNEIAKTERVLLIVRVMTMRR